MIMNPHVENSLIGAILIDPKKVLPEAALTLTAEAFQFGPSQRVYEICLDLLYVIQLWFSTERICKKPASPQEICDDAGFYLWFFV